MCGIAGACWFEPGMAVTTETMQRMIAALVHRGPDDFGIYNSSQSGNEPRAVLGHRRLSIIDLETGRQPLGNEDGTIQIVLNGEIYNYRDLRAMLQGRGHRFQTATDTEAIVHLYEEYGIDCVTHLRGMFAFAIWDERSRRLIVARDRLGQKPLYYKHEPNRLIFASEIKALLQVPGVARRLNPEALDAFLTYQYVPHPLTMFDGISKLPPAHVGIYENGTWSLRRYWLPPCDETVARRELGADADFAEGIPEPGVSSDEWRLCLRERLTESVRLRLRSDVPLGTFLSGGIDSTIITGLAQQLSEQRVKTFSIGFVSQEFDETSYARLAAKHLGTEHQEEVISPSALEILPRLIWHYDEPFADASAIPTMYLSRMTRENVTVALSGDGGDELFAGYDRYRAVQLAEVVDRLPRPMRSVLTSAWLRRIIPNSIRHKSAERRLHRWLEPLGLSPELRYLAWICVFGGSQRNSLYSDDFAETVRAFSAEEFLLGAYQLCPGRDFVTRTTFADMLTYLPCDILTKVDVAGMHVGLECRSPFLDHRVAELAAQMPLRLKLRGRQGKRVLIETFADHLPAAIQRRSKMGFGVPLSEWFRHELKPLLQSVLLDRVCLGRGYFRAARIEDFVAEHLEGRADHGHRLWALLCLELWHRMFLDCEMPPATAPTGL